MRTLTEFEVQGTNYEELVIAATEQWKLLKNDKETTLPWDAELKIQHEHVELADGQVKSVVWRATVLIRQNEVPNDPAKH